MSHFLVRCGNCKAVIRQCRCPGPKVEREEICEKCTAPPMTADKLPPICDHMNEGRCKECNAIYDEWRALRAEVKRLTEVAELKHNVATALRARVSELERVIEWVINDHSFKPPWAWGANAELVQRWMDRLGAVYVNKSKAKEPKR